MGSVARRVCSAAAAAAAVRSARGAGLVAPAARRDADGRLRRRHLCGGEPLWPALVAVGDARPRASRDVACAAPAPLVRRLRDRHGILARAEGGGGRRRRAASGGVAASVLICFGLLSVVRHGTRPNRPRGGGLLGPRLRPGWVCEPPPRRRHHLLRAARREGLPAWSHGARRALGRRPCPLPHRRRPHDCAVPHRRGSPARVPGAGRQAAAGGRVAGHTRGLLPRRERRAACRRPRPSRVRRGCLRCLHSHAHRPCRPPDRRLAPPLRDARAAAAARLL
mmetsp:Transcript_38765/g.124419  ORF Transcript_38765/g.124419 Transcript_38765/m.124419 type:complete len:280 (-) Transcript_38765:297-1136(-)